jgi:hypothetical protein
LNVEQKTAARTVLEEHCEMGMKYITVTGKTCAIGGLALAGGMSKNMLRRGDRAVREQYPAPSQYDEDKPNSLCVNLRTDILQVLEDTYGLSTAQAVKLQAANDAVSNNKTPQERRDHVLAVFDTLYYGG